MTTMLFPMTVQLVELFIAVVAIIGSRALHELQDIIYFLSCRFVDKQRKRSLFQGSKKVLSGIPGLLDFVAWQVTSKAYLPDGHRSWQVEPNSN